MMPYRLVEIGGEVRARHEGWPPYLIDYKWYKRMIKGQKEEENQNLDCRS